MMSVTIGMNWWESIMKKSDIFFQVILQNS